MEDLIITAKTPIAVLTVGQFLDILSKGMQPEAEQRAQKEYVYGIEGISELLGISRTTAQRYKNTILKPAIMQCGRKIVASKADILDLFAQNSGGIK